MPELPPLPPPRAAERLPSRAVLLPQQRREVARQFNTPDVRVMNGASTARAVPGGTFINTAPPAGGAPGRNNQSVGPPILQPRRRPLM